MYYTLQYLPAQIHNICTVHSQSYQGAFIYVCMNGYRYWHVLFFWKNKMYWFQEVWKRFLIFWIPTLMVLRRTHVGKTTFVKLSLMIIFPITEFVLFPLYTTPVVKLSICIWQLGGFGWFIPPSQIPVLIMDPAWKHFNCLLCQMLKSMREIVVAPIKTRDNK